MTRDLAELEARRAGRRQARHPAFEPQVDVTHYAAHAPVDGWDWAVRISIVGLFVIAMFASVHLLSNVVVPIVLGWVIATIVLPAVDFFDRRGLPRSLVIAGLITILLVAFATIVGLLSVPLRYWIGRATELGSLLREKLKLLTEPLAFFDEIGRAISELTGISSGGGIDVSISQSTMISAIFSTLTPFLTEFVLFLGALVFNLVYQREIQEGVVSLFRGDATRNVTRAILRDIERNMSRYFGTVTVVNIFVGLVATGIAYAVGLPHPPLWGVLAGTLNYIPYLGPTLVIAALFMISLLTSSSLAHAFIAPVAFLIFTTLEGQVITPTVVGHRMTVNPFLIFLSIAFWTWLWGVVGTFLAVPMVIVGLVLARHINRPEGEPVPVAAAEH